MRLLLPTNLSLVEESFLSSPFSRLLPELQLSSFQQSEQEGKSEGLQIIIISLALFSFLLSSLPDFSTGSGGKQEHQWYTAARSAAGGWTSITRVTQGTAEPAPWPTLIGRQSENQKSQVLLADLQMGAESCGGIMYTAKENSSGLQYLWTLFLSYLSVSLSLSLYDFRADCFILQLPSNPLACVSMWCRAGGEMWEREKEFKSSALSLSVRGVDGCWIFQLSAATASLLCFMEVVVVIVAGQMTACAALQSTWCLRSHFYSL